jgi:hypothetical protein
MGMGGCSRLFRAVIHVRYTFQSGGRLPFVAYNGVNMTLNIIWRNAAVLLKELPHLGIGVNETQFLITEVSLTSGVILWSMSSSHHG